ncbi:MAG: hypothetical protein JNM17_33090 [Archangium sp.]|nr:hypothetical protein [Archangium sp.]
MLMVAVLILGAAEGPVKLAVPGLSLSGIESRLGEAYVERFATLLGKDPRLKVTTRRDIESVLGIERQKQMLGCSDGSSTCLAELAGGLGVDAVLSGSLAKTGNSYIVTLRVVRTKDGTEVASSSERPRGDDALGEWFEAEAPRLADEIARSFGLSAPVVETKEGLHLERWVPAIAGVGCLAAGIGLQVAARSDAANLNQGTVPLAEAPAVVERGKATETASWVLLGAGVAAIAASVTWFIVGSAPAKLAVVPNSGGVFVSVEVTLP